jgi:hypothetical protein
LKTVVMDPLIQISLVMFAAGVLGGIINFLITDARQEAPLKWWQHVIVGVGASFMVPLFLNMISSGLIDAIDKHKADASGLFVLAGFCLVAAVSARAFIQSISKRLLQEVREARETAQEAKAEAAEAQNAVAPFVEEDVPEIANTTTADEVLERSPQLELTPDGSRLLKAFADSSLSMRSLTGLARDSRLEKPRVNTLLSALMSKGLVVQTQSKGGQPRWYLSPAGRQLTARS